MASFSGKFGNSISVISRRRAKAAWTVDGYPKTCAFPKVSFHVIIDSFAMALCLLLSPAETKIWIDAKVNVSIFGRVLIAAIITFHKPLTWSLVSGKKLRSVEDSQLGTLP